MVHMTSLVSVVMSGFWTSTVPRSVFLVYLLRWTWICDCWCEDWSLSNSTVLTAC